MTINQINKIYSRPWGSYKTLAFGANYQIKIITIESGGKLSLQKHYKRSEHWVITKGTVQITLDSCVKNYQINEHIFIPIESIHRIENLTLEPAELIEVQMGSYLGEDDIVRFDDAYAR